MAIALQTKPAAMKAPGRNAEAAVWRRGARDYGCMRARARLCTSASRSLRFGSKTAETPSSGAGGMSLCARPAGGCARGRGRAH